MIIDFPLTFLLILEGRPVFGDYTMVLQSSLVHDGTEFHGSFIVFVNFLYPSPDSHFDSEMPSMPSKLLKDDDFSRYF